MYVLIVILKKIFKSVEYAVYTRTPAIADVNKFWCVIRHARRVSSCLLARRLADDHCTEGARTPKPGHAGATTLQGAVYWRTE